MRKILLSLSIVFCFTMLVSAQESEREKGTFTKSDRQILPQAGDFAIGVDAAPFFNYAGNMFNGNAGNSSPVFGGITIYGKYFLENNRALRVRLLLDFSSETEKANVANNTSTAVGATVEDSWKSSTSAIQLNVGYEIRRGYGRLQGFYGGEVGLGFESWKDTYEYGNAYSTTNPNPTSTNFNGNAIGGARILTDKVNGGFNAGLGVFTGVEYFVAPKLSIGAEVGLGLGFASNGKTKLTTEAWNGTAIERTNTDGFAGAGNFNFSTRTGGNIFVLFHF